MTLPILPPVVAPRDARFLLAPSWDEGAFFEAESRTPIPGPELRAHVRVQEDRAADAWILLFHDLADPDDPWRARYLVPDGARRMEEAGRALLERLERHAPGQWAMEPQPWQRGPHRSARTARIRAEYEGEPLRLDDGDGEVPLRAHRFGISWSLARELERWQNRFDEEAELSPPERWTCEARAGHEARGAVLASRLAGELIATGREHMRVLYWAAGEARYREITPPPG